MRPDTSFTMLVWTIVVLAGVALSLFMCVPSRFGPVG
jgi:hypothetical protein